MSDKLPAAELRRRLLASVQALLDSRSDAEIEHLSRVGQLMVAWVGRTGELLTTHEALRAPLVPLHGYAPVVVSIERKKNPS